MPEPRYWITARLEGDDLRLSIAGAQTILEDEEDHRTRDAVATIDLSDPAAVRSARAIAPNIPDLDDRVGEIVAAALASVLEAYQPALTTFVRRQARAAEASALRHDNDAEPAGEVKPSGELRVQKGAPE